MSEALLKDTPRDLLHHSHSFSVYQWCPGADGISKDTTPFALHTSALEVILALKRAYPGRSTHLW